MVIVHTTGDVGLFRSPMAQGVPELICDLDPGERVLRIGLEHVGSEWWLMALVLTGGGLLGWVFDDQLEVDTCR